MLDGRTGNLVWSHMYPGYVRNLAIENNMLVIANQTGNVQGQLGQNGSVSNLDAWSFSTAGGTLQATDAWSVSTGAQWAPWLALEKLPNGKIAAAWTNSTLGSGNATNGNELVVSLATGATDWSVATTGYPRYLRFDSSRNQVVAIEEADPTSSDYAYSIVARNLADGSVANTVAESNATALNFQVGDLDGDGLAEWVVTDLNWLPCTPVTCGIQNTGRVLAINGGTGMQEWSQVRSIQFVDPANPQAGSGIPLPYGLLLAPNGNNTADVLVGSFIPGGDMELERLSGAPGLSVPAGTVLWSQSSANAFLPLFLSLYQQGGTQLVRAASSRARLYGFNQGIDQAGTTLVANGRTPFQVVRLFDASSGNQVSATPLLGRIQAVAGTDVNGDGTTDLVVGGESGAVFALDGKKIDDQPIVLWRRPVAGPVHQIAAADLDGDGHTEIVVAATHAIDVLDSMTGNLRYEIPYASDYIWNFVLADLHGDGKIDIVVPGASSINAYAGPNGSILWTYAPSVSQAAKVFGNVAITPDNIVTAQFAYGMQNPELRTGAGFTRGVVGINGATGTVLWSASSQSSTNSSWPQLWFGTVAGQLDGIVGSVTGYTWINYDPVQNAFTLGMEIRDALTGTIINSLPPPPGDLGSLGTLLIPEKGILSYTTGNGNGSWLLTPTNSGPALGQNSFSYDMAEGNFGVLGKRVIEAAFPFYVEVFAQNGIDFTLGTAAVADASFNSAVGEALRLYLQDLDHNGVDEIICVPLDWDGNSALYAPLGFFGYEQTTFSDGLDILELLPVPVQLNSVVSRKVHGGAGAFDVVLPLTGSPGIECRSGGPTNDYTLVFTFANTLASVAEASVTSGTGSVASSSIDNNDAHNYIVNLTGVANAQTITVSLTNVADSAGDLSSAVSASIGVLLGDVNSSRRVDAADVSSVRQQTLQMITNSNFRNDINASGRIDAADVSIARQQTLTSLP